MRSEEEGRKEERKEARKQGRRTAVPRRAGDASSHCAVARDMRAPTKHFGNRLALRRKGAIPPLSRRAVATGGRPRSCRPDSAKRPRGQTKGPAEA